MVHEEKKDWAFFRKAAEQVFWPHVEQEYRDELNGIVEGLKREGREAGHLGRGGAQCLAGAALLRQVVRQERPGTPSSGAGPGDHCSAFVATGSYTKDHRVVIAHNNWTSYSSGERWNIIFDITPAEGNRIIMDGMPGLIHSRRRFRHQLRRA